MSASAMLPQQTSSCGKIKMLSDIEVLQKNDQSLLQLITGALSLINQL